MTKTDMNVEDAVKAATDDARRQYIEPGYLVVGEICASGCASYRITNKDESIEANRLNASWHTDKTIADVAEHRSVKGRRRLICRMLNRLGTRVSGFGYVVPQTKADLLNEILQDVNGVVRSYNSNARHTRLSCSLAVFEIRGSDDRVALALYRRATELLERINDSLINGRIGEMRKQIKMLRGLDSILPSESAVKVNRAIMDARKAAKDAIRRTKDMPTEEANALTIKILSTVPVDAVRADLVEVTKEIEVRTEGTSYLSPVNARQIE